MDIHNKAELDAWMSERIRMGGDLVSIKGDAPEGATYEDGEPITNPINVAWQDISTGELFAIEYEV